MFVSTEQDVPKLLWLMSRDDAATRRSVIESTPGGNLVFSSLSIFDCLCLNYRRFRTPFEIVSYFLVCICFSLSNQSFVVVSSSICRFFTNSGVDSLGKCNITHKLAK